MHKQVIGNFIDVMIKRESYRQLHTTLHAIIPTQATIGITIFSALQIKVSQWSITANLRPLTIHIYHVMIIVTIGFSKESFIFINIIFIS